MPIKILIADDDPLIRQGLEIILSKDDDFKVIRSVENGQQALEACQSCEIDVALIDIRMPILNGVEAVKQISNQTQVKSIILTTFMEDELISAAVKNGAKAYILKGISPEEIKNTIKLVHQGNTVFNAGVFEKLRRESDDGPSSGFDATGLTQRELEIIKLIAQGHSNKKISEEIFLSESTVKNYVTSILSKLDLEQRTQIAVYYLTGKKN